LAKNSVKLAILRGMLIDARMFNVFVGFTETTLKISVHPSNWQTIYYVQL
jgi:hypothetical protein